MKKFSEQLIDLAERFADVTDAAQGHGHRQGGGIRARWVLIPAAGAGLFALGASRSFTRGAKSVVKQAKERASELPDDLMSRVHQATRTTSSTNGSRTQSTQRSRSRRTGTSRRRRTRTTASSR